MFVAPTPSQLQTLLADPPAGRFVMLNLLRFRDVADYAEHPALAPPTPISGADAYGRYEANVRPLLAEAGGSVLLVGAAQPYVIGPADESWDRVLLIEYPDGARFLKFTADPRYREGLGHRQAALADSRLLPILPAAG